MRLTGILLLAAMLQASAGGRAQTVTISAQGVPLIRVLSAIEKQTGYNIFYDVSDLEDSRPVTVQLKAAPLTEALAKVLEGQSLHFEIQGNTVSISRKVILSAPPVIALLETPPPPGDIHGRVTDSLGNPLAGASVIVKGLSKGVETDANGMFTVKGTGEDVTLVVSFTGYATREMKPGGKGAVLVVLPVSTSPLDQVQVIAYGTTTKRLNTGDVTTIQSETFAHQPVNNVLGAIEGRVPGMLIQQISGLPGTAVTAQVRGRSSLNNGTSPIYVVDGIPYTPYFSVGGPDGGNSRSDDVGTPLDYFNMNDIERIDVLKDADATSIYGSRGANGVILLTTKKGKAGKTKLEANLTSGFAYKTFPISFLNTPTYLQLRREAYKNDGITVLPANAYDINGTWDTTRYTDWQRAETGNKSQYTDAQLSISGGNNNTQYLVSGTYHRQSLIFPLTFANQRGSLHFNLGSHSQNNRFTMSLTGSFTAGKNNSLQQDMSKYTTYAPDAPPVYTPLGALNWAGSTWSNPFAALYMPDVSNVDNLESSYLASYEILPGLVIKSNFGYALIQTYEWSANPSYTFNPAYHAVNSANFSYQANHSYTINPQLAYDKHLGQSALSAVVGASIQHWSYNQGGIGASNYTSDEQLQSPLGAASVYGYTAFTIYKYAEMFGRLNYNYGNKYLLDLAVNRDGSSRFGPGRQFANFGSAAAAWIFTKEKWWTGAGFLNFGKIGVSYGTTGNDQIGNYQYLNLYGAIDNTGAYQNAIGLYPTSLNNPDFAWEVTKKAEIMLDLGFLKDRIIVHTDYYRNRSSDQLGQAPLPALVGPGSVTMNLPALIQNTGFELTINTTNIQHKNFSWKSNFNISFNRNKLLAYPNFAASYLSTSYELGKSMTRQKVFHCIGVNDTTGAYQFIDSKGNRTYAPTYTPNYLITSVDYAPRYYGGLENIFSYKGFQFSFFLNFVNQRGSDQSISNDAGIGTDDNIFSSAWKNMWHKPGDKARYERATATSGSLAYSVTRYIGVSDYAMVNSSYIRLTNVSLGYSLPRRWLAPLHLSDVRIHVEGQNLYTFTPFTGDPEVGYYLSTPLLKTIVAGIQVNL